MEFNGQMKKYISIFAVLSLLLFVCGCETFRKNCLDEAHDVATSTFIDLEGLCFMESTKEFTVCDFWEDNVLLLVYDPELSNESDINDEASTIYYEEFIVLDVKQKVILQRYPIYEFGIFKSAVYAFDGVLCSFFNVSNQQLDSSIIFLDGKEQSIVYQGDFTPFGTGPVLRRYQEGTLFSYYDCETDSFGINFVDSSLNVSPVLFFDGTMTDYISDDFSVSSEYCVYAVGENSSVTFYVGDASKENIKIKKIPLLPGKKIHGFSTTENTLFVSVSEDIGELKQMNPYIESFDIKTGISQNVFQLSSAFYNITASDDMLCGFSLFRLIVFEIADISLKQVELDNTLIHGDFYEVYPYKNTFLVVAYDFTSSPSMWLISGSI